MIVSNSALANPHTSLFENKNILILGGTGFLGRAIIAKLLEHNPKSIVVFGRDEVKHFNLNRFYSNNEKIQNIIGNIRDYNQVHAATRNIDIVFHAAALKRIDILETNVKECIKTNILGSMNVFNACVENQVEKVIFISTDKACAPINTYGACKFVSEKIFTNYDKKKINTQFMVARYGNVLESTGSVIPIFTDKIKRGDDITLTDNRMTRFIISKEQAVRLVFDALLYGEGGEIFTSKLPAMKIPDLIEILKKEYNSDSNIRMIGLRPGEKIHEILLNESEIIRAFSFKDYYIIKPSTNHTTTRSLYLEEGSPASESLREAYSSHTEIVAQQELYSLLKNHGILC